LPRRRLLCEAILGPSAGQIAGKRAGRSSPAEPVVDRFAEALRRYRRHRNGRPITAICLMQKVEKPCGSFAQIACRRKGDVALDRAEADHPLAIASFRRIEAEWL